MQTVEPSKFNSNLLIPKLNVPVNRCKNEKSNTKNMTLNSHRDSKDEFFMEKDVDLMSEGLSWVKHKRNAEEMFSKVSRCLFSIYPLLDIKLILSCHFKLLSYQYSRMSSRTSSIPMIYIL